MTNRNLQRISQFVTNRPFFKSVVILAGGTAAAQAIAILTTPIATRLYRPEDFGIMTVFAAILGITAPLSTLRYSTAIPIAENEDRAYDVLRLCFLITCFIALLLGLGLLLFGSVIGERYPDSDIGPYLWLIPPSLFGVGLYEALSAWSVRGKRFKLVAQTNLSQSIWSATVKIGLGWFGVRPLGLLLGIFFASASGSGSMLLALFRQQPNFLRDGSWKGISVAAKRFVRFPLLQSWSQLLLALGTQLPAIFIASLYGAKTAGLYGLAFNMINLPMGILGRSVAQAYLAEIAQYGKSRPDKILALSITVVRKLIFVAAGPIAFLAVTGPMLFAFFFGEEWREAGLYARYLALYAMCLFATAPVAQCLNVLNAQGIQLATNAVRTLVAITVFLICWAMNIDSLDAIMFFSLVFAAFQIALLMMLFGLLSVKARNREIDV